MKRTTFTGAAAALVILVTTTAAALVARFAPRPVPTHIPAAAVSQAFAEGRPLLETEQYKIHASRRERPGVAEIHERDTDIIYVLEGGATIVTGGRIVDSRRTGQGEIRGSSIAGGAAQRLAKGDVLVVPNGMAHWFSEVDAPFVYYVVKAANAGGGER